MKYEQQFVVKFNTLLHYTDPVLNEATVKIVANSSCADFKVIDAVQDLLNQVQYHTFVSYHAHQPVDGGYYVIVNRHTQHEQLLSRTSDDQSEVKYYSPWGIDLYKARDEDENIIMMPGDSHPRSVCISLLKLIQTVTDGHEHHIEVSVSSTGFTVST